MKWLIRQFLFHLTALLAAVYLIPGFTIGNTLENILLATIALGTINIFIKPIIKLLFLPLNMVTLGLFSIVINTGIVYALTYLLPHVAISPFKFNGYSFSGFIIPPFDFTVLYTYILVAIVLTSIVSFLNWMVK